MMADQNTAPGGFTSGKEALEALAESIRLLGAYDICKARLNHALTELTQASGQAENRRRKALEAIDYFAEQNPSSLGIVWPDPALELHIEDAGLKFEDVLSDVEAILQGRGKA